MKTSATRGAWSVIPRIAVTAALALLVGLLTVSGGPAATLQDGESEEKRMTTEEARVEASGWPDFDSTAFADQVAEKEAAKAAAVEEAAGWPNFDPSSLADQVAKKEAAKAAAAIGVAGWPDFDSTAIETSASGQVARDPVTVGEMLRGGLSAIWFDE